MNNQTIMGLGLVPLMNFAVVDSENHIYRCAQPHIEYQYKWLKDVLKLETIVNLRSELNIDSKFGERHEISVHTFKVADHNEPTVDQANRFVELIRNKKPDSPLLFHCEHGHGRTSTFCVLTRLAQGWALEKALQEESNIFHYSFKHHAQIEFLERFYKNEIMKKKEHEKL